MTTTVLKTPKPPQSGPIETPVPDVSAPKAQITVAPALRSKRGAATV